MESLGQEIWEAIRNGDADGIRNMFRFLEGPREDKEFETVRFSQFNEAGVSFAFDKNDEIVAVHLYGENVDDDLKPFRHPLPFGVVFGDQRQDVLRKLKKPPKKSGGGALWRGKEVPFWDRFEFSGNLIHFQYSRVDQGVELVTLMAESGISDINTASCELSDSTMTFDASSWRFPIENLILNTGVLCLTKDENEAISLIGIRLEFQPMLLPHINWSYKESHPAQPEVTLDCERPFQSLEKLSGKKIKPPFLQRYGEGSVYLFGAHNPVDWKFLSFGKADGDQIPFSTRLRFDFDAEGRIGGTFEHSIECILKVERRWELF